MTLGWKVVKMWGHKFEVGRGEEEPSKVERLRRVNTLETRDSRPEGNMCPIRTPTKSCHRKGQRRLSTGA